MAQSHTMRVIEISKPGGPEVLKPATRAVPVPGAGEIVIRVAYAGVNRPDALFAGHDEGGRNWARFASLPFVGKTAPRAVF